MSIGCRKTSPADTPRSTTRCSSEYSIVSAAAKRSRVLNREQELELTRSIRDSGDSSAADSLVRAHLRLVIAIAIRYRHYGVPVCELVAEGNAGLFTALAKFDPERGIRFATYAKHWIVAKVLGHVIQASSGTGGNSGALRSRLFFKLRRERARFNTLHGEGPASSEALANRLDMTPKKLQGLLDRLDSRTLPLDAETLTSTENPEQSYFEEQQRQTFQSAVSQALGQLDSRERFIIERRTMALDSDELSLAQIGRLLGISRERARQLEERAKRKLRNCPAIHRNVRLNEWRSNWQRQQAPLPSSARST